jgi:hypothetical protein
MLKQLKIVGSMIAASMTLGLGVAIGSMISLKAPLPDLGFRFDLNRGEATEYTTPEKLHPCP